MTPSPARHRHLDFRPGDSTRTGIDATRQALADWHLHAAAPDALLIAAELLANAALHTLGPLSLDLDLDDGDSGGGGGAVLRITVTDPLPDPPRPRPHRPDQPHGHGLHLVRHLSTAWGHHPHGRGKQVWAEITAAPSAPA